MKIVLISDTHNKHDEIILPEGDMIIHAGDVSGSGTFTEILTFQQWFSRLDFKHKIFIAGNHDFAFEKLNMSHALPEGVTYLQDTSIEIEGLKIYGSPYTPKFYNWAFMKNRGPEIKQVWDLIPDRVDILVTHGPPHQILDENAFGKPTGCLDLLNRVNEVKPSIHVFGHIHEAYGMIEISGTRYFNASSLDDNYRVRNAPFVVEL
jgi:Icc-related predicted phosphoesterase